ncbi:hypothetical protein [Haloarcula halophila]|uniref:hypothetical protein n=1 Tax=Haloarcula TaxID=2237 RepID=UPI0023E39318|nr:hypothetical protein [Halomicroarcula sp. DFY41]
MADLLTHLLAPLIVLTVVGWRVEWLETRLIALVMGGAAIPDLVKVGIVLDSTLVRTALGVPFSYAPLSTLGGVLMVAGLITLLFARRH